MSQQLLIGDRPLTAADVPTTIQDRAAAFIVETINDMQQGGSTSKAESISGTRFSINGYAVRIDGVKITIIAPPKEKATDAA